MCWCAVKKLLTHLNNSPTGETAHHIFTLYGSNNTDSHKGVPFLALIDTAAHLKDQIAKSPNFGGANRHFPAKHDKYWNIHIIKTTASIINKFCRVIETPSTHCGWSKYAPNKSKMADDCHLEKSKNLNIFTSDWPMSTKSGMLMRLDPLDPDSQYNFVISKIQDGGGGHLKIWKYCQHLRNWKIDFDEILHNDASGQSRHRLPIKFHKFETPRWRGRHLE